MAKKTPGEQRKKSGEQRSRSNSTDGLDRFIEELKKEDSKNQQKSVDIQANPSLPTRKMSKGEKKEETRKVIGFKKLIEMVEPDISNQDLFNRWLKNLYNKYAACYKVEPIVEFQGHSWLDIQKVDGARRSFALLTAKMSTDRINHLISHSSSLFNERGFTVLESIKNITETYSEAAKKICEARKNELLQIATWKNISQADFNNFNSSLDNFFNELVEQHLDLPKLYDSCSRSEAIFELAVSLIFAPIKVKTEQELEEWHQQNTANKGVSGDMVNKYQRIMSNVVLPQLEIEIFKIYDYLNLDDFSIESVINNIKKRANDVGSTTNAQLVDKYSEFKDGVLNIIDYGSVSEVNLTGELERARNKGSIILRKLRQKDKAEFAKKKKHENSINNLKKLFQLLDRGDENDSEDDKNEEKEFSPFAVDAPIISPSPTPSPASAQPLSEIALKNQEDEEKSKENFRQELAQYLSNNQMPANFLDNKYINPTIITGMYRSLRAMEKLNLYPPEDLSSLLFAGGVSEENKTSLINSFLTNNIRNFFKGQIFTMDADGNKVFNLNANRMANLLMHDPDYLSFKQKQDIARFIIQENDEDFTKSGYIDRVLKQIGAEKILELYDEKKSRHLTSGPKDKITNIKKLFASIDQLKKLLDKDQSEELPEQENSFIYDDICCDIMVSLGGLVQEVRGVRKSSHPSLGRELLSLCKDYRDFVSHGTSENFDLPVRNATQDGSLILGNPMEAVKKTPNSQERDVAIQKIYLEKFKAKFSKTNRRECLELLEGQMMGRGR
ncbi:MAG: hypothetical protein K0R25_45 [Rickettsiaceae bacterium]|jgi:hypothetical protein|nr:hypothetical protein [Rickettsiaceae bacterium]